MDDFLTYLAERKYSLYHYLFFAKPQAYSIEDCQKRIEINTKYQEVMNVITHLPLKEQLVVENRFKELKETL